MVYCVNPVNSRLIVSKSSQCVLEGLEPRLSWLEELKKDISNWQVSAIILKRSVMLCSEGSVKGIDFEDVAGVSYHSSDCVRSVGQRLNRRICPCLHGNTSYGSIWGCIAEVLWAAWRINTLLKTDTSVCMALGKGHICQLYASLHACFISKHVYKKQLLAHVILLYWDFLSLSFSLQEYHIRAKNVNIQHLIHYSFH